MSRDIKKVLEKPALITVLSGQFLINASNTPKFGAAICHLRTLERPLDQIVHLSQKRTHQWKVKWVSHKSSAKSLRGGEGAVPLFWRCLARFMQANVQLIGRTSRNRKYEALHKKHNCVVCTEVREFNVIKTNRRFSSASQNNSEQNLCVCFKMCIKTWQI